VAKSFLHTFIEMWLPHNNDSGERQVPLFSCLRPVVFAEVVVVAPR
jgi:hypothetical protein